MALRYLVLMLRRLTVIAVLVVLLPASAVDAFLHLHDDPEHNHHAAITTSEGILHTHLAGSPSDHDTAAVAESGQRYGKLRFANLFRFVPAVSFVPAICLETVQLVPALTCSSSRVVELVPSAHDPPSLDCSIPRSPPA